MGTDAGTGTEPRTARLAALAPGVRTAPGPAATSGVVAGASPASRQTAIRTSAGATTPGTSARASQPAGRGYVDTATENRLAGTPGWQSVRSTRRTGIEGFADSASTVAGRPVRLFVSTTAATFRVQLLRLGWYGGVGARQVWMSAPVPGTLQAHAATDPATHLITAPWKVSAVIPTDGLVAGDYLAKLVGADGSSSFVPVVVREERSTGAVVLLNSTLTWQAYNSWGGGNSYSGAARTGAEGYTKRSVVSSYDRPYLQGSGAGGLIEEEYNLIQLAERLGLRLNYGADVDLQVTPAMLDGATGIALLGHSEYWSRPMRTALTLARDSGVNLAFLGANDVYRRIRLQPTATGPARLLINYKDGTADPVKTVDTTADWPHAPFSDPEADITGVQYRCAHAHADMVIVEPNGWLFRGLGLHPGQKLPGMVGTEFDRVTLGVSTTPRPIEIMAHSPVSCNGYPERSDLAWYTAASGAGVFAAGTLGWDHGIKHPDRFTRTIVSAVTERVFRAMAQPYAGRLHPATDNALTFYTASGVPVDNGRKVPAAPAPGSAKNPTVD